MNLYTDPTRINLDDLTGVYVRQQHPDTQKWASMDIACLDKTSLALWLDEVPERANRLVMYWMQHDS